MVGTENVQSIKPRWHERSVTINSGITVSFFTFYAPLNLIVFLFTKLSILTEYDELHWTFQFNSFIFHFQFIKEAYEAGVCSVNNP